MHHQSHTLLVAKAWDSKADDNPLGWEDGGTQSSSSLGRGGAAGAAGADGLCSAFNACGLQAALWLQLHLTALSSLNLYYFCAPDYQMLIICVLESSSKSAVLQRSSRVQLSRGSTHG